MSKTIKVVYIAGPYRGKTINDTRKNIRRAEMVAEMVWEKGFAAFCPHTNSAFMDGACSDEHFLAATQEMLIRCDVMLLTPNCYHSQGTFDEVALAIEEGIQVYSTLERLVQENPLSCSELDFIISKFQDALAQKNEAERVIIAPVSINRLHGKHDVRSH